MDEITNPAPAFLDSLYLHHCGFEHCAPEHNFGPAIRDHTLLHMVLNGKGKFYAGGKCYELHAGEGFLILPGAVTTYTADRENPWYYCWVGCSGTDVPRIIQSCGISPEQPIFRFDSPDRMEHCVAALLDSVGPEQNQFATTARLYDFFAAIAGSFDRQAGPKRSLLDNAIDYIARNYSYHITVEDIARYTGIDRSHLFRIFKKELGCSPQEYLLDYKLSRAALLLSQSTLSVTETMYSSGFADLPNFSKQFKKKFSCSPAQFRREKRRSPLYYRDNAASS